MFGHMGRLLVWWSKRSPDLLHRACVVTALASVLLTNGTCCVVFMEFELEFAFEQSHPAICFLFQTTNRYLEISGGKRV
jgi:hypothetical protein